MSTQTDTSGAIAAVLRRKAATQPLWIPVSGQSMGRSIGDGRVRVAPAARPRRGEVWAFVIEGRIIVHRFLGARHGRLWMQGDANPSPDPPVSGEVLIGKVVTVERGDGRERRFTTGLGLARASPTRRGRRAEACEDLPRFVKRLKIRSES